jgi:hypothetical protein
LSKLVDILLSDIVELESFLDNSDSLSPFYLLKELVQRLRSGVCEELREYRGAKLDAHNISPINLYRTEAFIIPVSKHLAQHLECFENFLAGSGKVMHFWAMIVPPLLSVWCLYHPKAFSRQNVLARGQVFKGPIELLTPPIKPAFYLLGVHCSIQSSQEEPVWW